jgi:hypothetical protein
MTSRRKKDGKTTAEMAREQGGSVVTIRRWAARLGVAKVGKDFLFNESDEALLLANLREGPGNPNFVQGNEFARLGAIAKRKSRRRVA